MAKKLRQSEPVSLDYRYQSPNIPMSAIRRFARQIAAKFHPDKIILFGSYAYGEPHEWSDVDLLVVMPANDQTNQAIRITRAFKAPFSLDLIVRTPERLRRDVKDGDWFLQEITSKGKVLYEKDNGSLGPKSGGRHHRRARARPPKTAGS